MKSNITLIFAVYLMLSSFALFSQVKFESGKVVGCTTTWQTITLENTYTNMVVAATPSYNNSELPLVAMIRNATGNSFEVKVQNPSKDGGVTGDVYYIVAEEGQYTVATHGIKFEAYRYSNSKVCSKNTNWNQVNSPGYINSYVNPVVVGQLMDVDNPSAFFWGAFWACGNSKSNPPTNSHFKIGVHVAEGSIPSNKNSVLGYMVFESGYIEFTASGSKTIKLEAGLGNDKIKGFTNNPPFTYSLTGSLSDASVAVLSSAAMDGGDGGWPVLYGNTPFNTTQINLAIDEDQTGDSERGHIDEQVAYVVLSSESNLNYYYSDGDANVNDLNSWWANTDGTGAHPTDFTSDNQMFVIQSGDTYSTSNDWTVSGVNSGIEVQAGSKLILNNNIEGNCNFDLKDDGILEIKDALGITSSGASGGIQNTGTRQFGTGANYIYSGSAIQVTGSGLPGTVEKLTINNTAGVQLSNSVSVSNTLDLQQGDLQINDKTLTIDGILTRTGSATGTLTGSSLSNLTITGSGAIPEFYFTNANEELNNLELDRSGAVISLNKSLTIKGTLTLNNGIINNGTNTILIDNAAANALNGGSGSSFIQGILQRKLTANISADGTDYLFPIGENGLYKPTSLLDSHTGATTPVMQCQVSSDGTPTAGSGIDAPIGPRNWYIEVTSGDFTSAKVQLSDDGITPSHTIGSSATQSGTYNSVLSTAAVGSIETTNPIANPSLPAYFSIGLSLVRTYYSYQNGDWDAASYTWTLDPSGTLQIGNTIPGNGDKVVILSGRTVKLTNDVTSLNLDITINAAGFLDMEDYSFTNGLLSLAGRGTLMLSSVNFPATTTNTFVQDGGGTVEYNNTTDFQLSVFQTEYNNLTLNAPSVTATQLHNLNLNGNLYIKSGNYRINDNSSTTALNLDITGNVTVDANGEISVGNGVTNTSIGGTGGTAPFLNYYKNFHSVIIKGDFTNNGTVKFTNINYPVYNAFPPTSVGATSGAATVYFQGLTNNELLCNGTTIFYNLVLDKGIDQTYSLSVYSTDYNNFRLYGANNQTIDGSMSANPNLRKALWLRNGTLVLDGSLSIPSLSEGTTANSEYYIPANAALTIDGVDVMVNTTADDYKEVNLCYNVSGGTGLANGVTIDPENSLFLFGKLKVNNGSISTKESTGIITNTTASGQLEINGGTVDTKQLLGATGSASFMQTDGLLITRGRFQRTPAAMTSIADLKDFSTNSLNRTRAVNGVAANYGSFNLENSSNVFVMSGGTIRIYDVCGTSQNEAFDVKADVANINVTGGTLEIIPTEGLSGTNSSEYKITTTAPLGSLIVDRQSGTASAMLDQYSLTLLDDFTLMAGEFDANNLDLTIGGNVLIENGTTYNHGSNTTYLNGTEDQSFTVNTASALSLNNFNINIPADKTVEFAGSQKTINVNNDFSLSNGTMVDNGNTINIKGNVFNSGVHEGSGKIALNGNSPQTIDGNGIFENLELNNTDGSGAPISLLDNVTINGELNLANNKLFNINSKQVLFNEEATIVGFNQQRYMKTSGTAGDGGVAKKYETTSTSFTFPVGIDNYTPSTVVINGTPTTYGTIQVNPVNYEHPNVTETGRSLDYFWRIKTSNFDLGAARADIGFKYAQADVVSGGDVTEGEYVAARFNPQDYTWTKGTTADVDESDNEIGVPTGGSFLINADFISGDYTAGDDNPTNPFGTPSIFYSRQSGLWSNANTWSFDSHSGAANTGGTVPGARDIVIIGGDDEVELYTESTNANQGVQNCASLKIEEGATLDVGYNPACNFGMVLNHENGNGLFRLTCDRGALHWSTVKTFGFPQGDFSEFNVNLGTTELYTTNPVAGTTFYLPNGTESYGNLIISPLGGSNIIFPNNDLEIFGNLITRGQNADSWFCPVWNTNYPTPPYAKVEKTITIKGNLHIEGGGLVWYGNNNQQDFVIYGDLIADPWTCVYRYNGSAQSISIGGNLINNTSNAKASGVSTKSQCDFTDIPLTFFGNNSSEITNTAGSPYTKFDEVIINKGNSPATTLTCNIGGTIQFDKTNNWLTLQNGTFIYESNVNLPVSTSTDFIIPPTAGLTINTASEVYIANTNSNDKSLFLNGKLTIENGHVYIGPKNNTSRNADIEYSGSGFSEIEINGGELIVNGQIRRPTSTTNGTLKYTQTGGNLYIYGNNAENTRGKLEILNSGSRFDMSGGKIHIIRGGGSTFGDLYIRPETSVVTGGTILFSQEADGSMPNIDSDQSYLLDANVPLNDLTLKSKTEGTDRNASLSLMVSALSLNGSLDIDNSKSIFDSNNRDVSLKGNLENDGQYIYGTNTTTFNGTTQQILGNSTTDFNNLTVESANSLSLTSELTVFGDLQILNGTLAISSYRINLQGDLTNNSAYTDDNLSGTGIAFSGSSLQQITGTGAYGRIKIDNLNNVVINNDIMMNSDLELINGLLDIGQHQLTLSAGSTIEGAPFNATKMIKTDGVTSSKGVRKFFNSGATNFTFPIGVSGKYTPAIFEVTANSSVGLITVNPVNSYHSTVLDPDNVLQYYWEIESSGISGLTGNIKLNYNDSEAKGAESDYVAARLELPGDYWLKAYPGAATDNVDENNNEILFTFSTSNNLSGDYTAGTDPAIPEQVPTYQTNANGNWSDESIWDPIGAAPPCPVGGPNGYIVIIDHSVTTDQNNCFAYRTTINDQLRVVAPTFGHNLGGVYGEGTLYVESGNLPAGDYSEFLSCEGNATLEYGGTGSYTNIASLYERVPNLKFSGTGTRVLYDRDLTICNSLVIDGPILDNSVNNRKFIIEGTMEIYNTGQFKSGTGEAPTATVTFAGDNIQFLGGALGDFKGDNAFNNLEIDNPAGLMIGLNGEIEIKNKLLLTSGTIKTSATDILKIVNTAENAVEPAGGAANSYIDGPLSKVINNGESFLYPLGKGTTKGHDFKVTSAAGSTESFSAEFFTPNSTATSYANPLVQINKLEYWKVSTGIASDAKVEIGFDALSDLNGAMPDGGPTDLRIATYNGSEWEMLGDASDADVSGTPIVGNIASRASAPVDATGTDFTVACVSTPKPFAAFATTDAVCAGEEISVSFTSHIPISLNYKLEYTINGTPYDVEISSLPYSLPTTIQGEYQLTGFYYDNGTVEGVVDNTIVEAFNIPIVATAGDDQDLCNMSGATLDGNNPGAYDGKWEILSGTGGIFVNNELHNTDFAGSLTEVYTLQWTISNGACSSSDQVQVSFPIAPAKPSPFMKSAPVVCEESDANIYKVHNVAGNTYNWSYDGTGVTIDATDNIADLTYATDATNGTLSVTAENSCGTSEARTVEVDVRERGLWIGDNSSDWSNTSNWNCPRLPRIQDDVLIPAGTPYMPVISANDGFGNNITIENSASLEITSTGTFTLNGDWNNNGVFTADPQSLVIFNGVSNIGGTSVNSFGSIQINGEATAPANMNVSGNWTNNGTFNHNNGTVTFNGTGEQLLTTTAGQSETFNQVTINENANLKVEAHSNMRVEAHKGLKVDGMLTIGSTADATASLFDNDFDETGSGQFNIQRYLWSRRYQDISSPVPDANVSIINNLKSLRKVVEADWTDKIYSDPGYKYVTSGSFAPTEGYVVYVWTNQTLNFTSSEINTGDYSCNVTKLSSSTLYAGENLVGNPYPSGLSLEKFLLENATADGVDAGIENYIYMWDEPAGGLSYDNAGKVQVNAAGIKTGGFGSPNSGTIYTGQGFYVKAKEENYTLKFNNSMRVKNDNSSYFFKSGNRQYSLFQLAIFDGINKYNDFALAFAENATDDFDIIYDVKKEENRHFNIYMVDNAGRNLSIQGIKNLKEQDEKIVPFGIELSKSGVYKFEAIKIDGLSNISIYLVDSLANKTIDIKNNFYDLKLEKGVHNNRFYIVFKNIDEINNSTEDIIEEDEIVNTEQENDVQENDSIASNDNAGIDEDVDLDDTLSENQDNNFASGINDYKITKKDLDIYSYKNRIFVRINNPNIINPKLNVYSSTGNLVMFAKLPFDYSAIDFPYPVGIYIVKVSYNNNTYTKLLYINY